MATRLVVRGATIIDGTGGEPIRDGVLVAEGERITQVGSARDFGSRDLDGADTRVVDAADKWVTPGLVNLHEHLDTHRGVDSFQVRAAQPLEWLILRSFRNALTSLIMGVTTVRDMGSKGATNIVVRDAINAGQVLGPRVYACGAPISMTGGHGAEICIEADGVDQVRLAARQLLKKGADIVKVMASGGHVTEGRDLPWSPQLTFEEMQAAIDEAHKAGKPTGAHCHPAAAIKTVVEAGVDTVEHGSLIDREGAELVAKRGVFLVPTIDEPFMIAELGEQLRRPRWLIEACKSRLDHRLESVSIAIQAGVKLGAGTDVAGEMGREMQHMVDAGLAPMDALIAGTRHGAEVLQLRDQIGTLEAGKLADLVVLDEDPLRSVLACDRPSLVVKGGVVHDPAQLRLALGPVAS